MGEISITSCFSASFTLRSAISSSYLFFVSFNSSMSFSSRWSSRFNTSILSSRSSIFFLLLSFSFFSCLISSSNSSFSFSISFLLACDSANWASMSSRFLFAELSSSKARSRSPCIRVRFRFKSTRVVRLSSLNSSCNLAFSSFNVSQFSWLDFKSDIRKSHLFSRSVFLSCSLWKVALRASLSLS